MHLSFLTGRRDACVFRVCRLVGMHALRMLSLPFPFAISPDFRKRGSTNFERWTRLPVLGRRVLVLIREAVVQSLSFHSHFLSLR